MNKNGFTIIEMVIAIFVMVMGIIGAFGAFSSVGILASDSADKLIATYLAQEGIELVRNIRDSNWLEMDLYETGNLKETLSLEYTTPSWSNKLTNFSNNEFKIDWKNGYWLDYKNQSKDDYLKVDNNGFYSYEEETGQKTKFKRKIFITEIPDISQGTNPDTYHILKVKVEVSWDRKANIFEESLVAGDCQPNNCIAVEEVLYNWYNTDVFVTDISADCESVDVVPGETGEIKVTVNPFYAKNLNITWFLESNDGSYITFSDNPPITALIEESDEEKKAIATINFTAGDQEGQVAVIISSNDPGADQFVCYFNISDDE